MSRTSDEGGVGTAGNQAIAVAEAFRAVAHSVDQPLAPRTQPRIGAGATRQVAQLQRIRHEIDQLLAPRLREPDVLRLAVSEDTSGRNCREFRFS